jgi:alkaline phosphatase D
MSHLISRRRALTKMSSIALASVSIPAFSEEPNDQSVFAHGVASGDPDHHSVVIWSRVSKQKETTAVDWEV